MRRKSRGTGRATTRVPSPLFPSPAPTILGLRRLAKTSISPLVILLDFAKALYIMRGAVFRVVVNVDSPSAVELCTRLKYTIIYYLQSTCYENAMLLD